MLNLLCKKPQLLIGNRPTLPRHEDQNLLGVVCGSGTGKDTEFLEYITINAQIFKKKTAKSTIGAAVKKKLMLSTNLLGT